jgi:iron complex transport system ATP-binding protein
MSNFFEIHDFACGYGDKFRIEHIDISLPKGSFAGIIGPNGSGKTTLFRGITGELAGTSGSIVLHGRNLNKMGFRKKARHLAIVTQDLEMPDITVEDYVLMGRFPYHKPYQLFETMDDVEIAQKYMTLTGITHLKGKYLHQLSGGELQLTSITRALVQEPELLLLDEPTSHLDITHQVQVLNLVQKLNAQLGLTVLMIIHDLNLAAEYCDQLILVCKGGLHSTGKPEDVLTYKNIEEVYGTVVVTNTNPVSGKPVIFLVSEKILQKIRDEYKV